QQHDEPDDEITEINISQQSDYSHSGVPPPVPRLTAWIGSERPVAFDAEGQAVKFAVRGDDHVAVVVEAQADQADAGDDDLGLGVRRDLDDAAVPAAARRHVEVIL